MVMRLAALVLHKPQIPTGKLMAATPFDGRAIALFYQALH